MKEGAAVAPVAAGFDEEGRAFDRGTAEVQKVTTRAERVRIRGVMTGASPPGEDHQRTPKIPRESRPAITQDRRWGGLNRRIRGH
jgi:hypothetical protein